MLIIFRTRGGGGTKLANQQNDTARDFWFVRTLALKICLLTDHDTRVWGVVRSHAHTHTFSLTLYVIYYFCAYVKWEFFLIASHYLLLQIIRWQHVRVVYIFFLLFPHNKILYTFLSKVFLKNFFEVYRNLRTTLIKYIYMYP